MLQSLSLQKKFVHLFYIWSILCIPRNALAPYPWSCGFGWCPAGETEISAAPWALRLGKDFTFYLLGLYWDYLVCSSYIYLLCNKSVAVMMSENMVLVLAAYFLPVNDLFGNIYIQNCVSGLCSFQPEFKNSYKYNGSL